jgi:hypothetical protein
MHRIFTYIYTVTFDVSDPFYDDIEYRPCCNETNKFFLAMPVIPP